MQLYYPEESSVLEPSMLVDWKKSRGLYNFGQLPQTAVICVDFAVLKNLVSLGTKKLKGIKGNHFIKRNILFCSGFDNGAPGLLNLLEELRALGVQRFVFAGLAGMLSSATQEGSIYAIEKAISGCGASAYYLPQTMIEVPDKGFYTQISSALQLPATCCFSTDAPFRETRAVLDQAVQQGAALIEMECAALYAFGAFYGLPVLCLLVAADNLTGAWTAPRNFPELIAGQNRLVHRLVQILN